MDIEYIKNNYRFETLNESHNLSDFICESEDLTNFLINDALNQQKDKINLTKLIICDDEIIGYVSLLTDTIEIKKIRDDETKKSIKNHLNSERYVISKSKLLPAIKIGRFAIKTKYSNQGLGTEFFGNIMYAINELSKKNVGFRFVVVEGYARAYPLYVNKFNFINLKKDDILINNSIQDVIKKDPEHTFYLYYDLKNYSD